MTLTTGLNPSLVHTNLGLGRFLQAKAHGTRKVRNFPLTQEQDFKFEKMISVSDTSKSRDWEVLCDQWGFFEYEYYDSGKVDFFGNKPHNVYTFINFQNSYRVEMGPDDVKKLFPDLAELVDILRDCRRNVNCEEVINVAFDFYKRAALVGEKLKDLEPPDLKDRFLSLVYLFEYLSDAEKIRLCRIVDLVSEADAEITVTDRHWIGYKSQEICLASYDALKKDFLRLAGIVDGEIDSTLSEFRATVVNKMQTYKRSGTGFQSALDGEVAGKLAKLHLEGFSFLKIYQLESEYRALNGKPAIFEQV